MRLTFEQGAVVSAQERNLIVQAYAGTGKTSTLVRFAEARPGERMLYLAFNKAVQTEGTRKFPTNVECRTTHSLAFAPYGRQFGSKLKQPRAFEISRAFQCDLKHAQHALETVMAWCCSADDQIELKHFAGRDDAKRDLDYPNQIVHLARHVWARMSNPTDFAVPIPHDGYLKLYQLSRPDLSRYERILFDECQDANPVTTAIVMSQPRCRVVMVGDAHQAIYQFRGAENAIQSAPDHWRRLNLTRSFRFGPGVAEVANILLSLKGERAKIVGGAPRTTEWTIDKSRQFTVISRTNAALLGEAVRNRGRKLAWVGGLNSYPIDRVVDAYSLKRGDRAAIRDDSFRAFTDYGHMQIYAQSVNDVELIVLIGLVEEYGSRLPSLVAEIRQCSIDDLDTADIILTTAHRSKGLEWSQVQLTDDYIDLEEEEAQAKKEGVKGPLTPKGADELNVLYVATTRALDRLVLPGSLLAYIGNRPELVRGTILEPLLEIELDEDEDAEVEEPIQRRRAAM